MPTHRPLAHWLLLFALVAMWGSSFLFTKIAVSHLQPTTVVAARLAIAALFLIAGLLAAGRRLTAAPRLWTSFSIMAVVGNALPFWLISWGQQRIDSGLAGILMAVMPLSTIVLAHLFVEGERLGWRKGLGFVTGFLGIVVLMGPEALAELEGSGSALTAELAVLGGAVCYAVNTIIARRRPASDAWTAATGVAVAASVIMLPVAVATGEPAGARLPLSALAAVGFLGIVSTGIATIVYFKLITAAGPSFLSLINYLIPIWAVALGIVAADERPHWTALAALVLVLLGIAVSERHFRGARPE